MSVMELFVHMLRMDAENYVPDDEAKALSRQRFISWLINYLASVKRLEKK